MVPARFPIAVGFMSTAAVFSVNIIECLFANLPEAEFSKGLEVAYPVADFEIALRVSVFDLFDQKNFTLVMKQMDVDCVRIFDELCITWRTAGAETHNMQHALREFTVRVYPGKSLALLVSGTNRHLVEHLVDILDQSDMFLRN